MTPEDILASLPEPRWDDEPAEDCNLETGEPKDPDRPGRHRADIPQESVIKLARLHCSTSEIADFFNVDTSVISRRFGKLIRQCQTETRARLRQEQLRLALSGNATMLIFLGKVMLHQREDAPAEEDKILPWTD